MTSRLAPPPAASVRPVRARIPAIAWLRDYPRAGLRHDGTAGIALAAYLLPAGLGDTGKTIRVPLRVYFR
jgi:hypothetical protein